MRIIVLTGIVLIVRINPAQANVTLFNNTTSWKEEAPEHSTITFTELPANTWITDQYIGLGVLFTDGSDLIYENANVFTDGFGLNGAFDETTLQFEIPLTALAMDFPGRVRVQLYAEGELIYTSPLLGTMPIGNFAGLVSTIPFDMVFLDDPLLGLVVDNLYFGPPIPAPGALAVLACAALLSPRRRRRP